MSISFSVGWCIYYGVCIVFGALMGVLSINRTQIKWWLVWKMEPWYEERASLDLAWRVFARKHNTSGARPICSYRGWEKDLDPDEKAAVYEFPNGDPSALPNCLQEAADAAEKQRVLMRRKEKR